MEHVSATLSILLTWMEGCEPDEEPVEPAPMEPLALDPEVLAEPLEDGLLEEALLPLLLFVTVPVTATSCPMWEFNFEVSALAGMIR